MPTAMGVGLTARLPLTGLAIMVPLPKRIINSPLARYRDFDWHSGGAHATDESGISLDSSVDAAVVDQTAECLSALRGLAGSDGRLDRVENVVDDCFGLGARVAGVHEDEHFDFELPLHRNNETLLDGLL